MRRTVAHRRLAALAVVAAAGAGRPSARRGRQARHGEVRQLVQRGGAAGVRARHGAAALVRVRAGDRRLQDASSETDPSCGDRAVGDRRWRSGAIPFSAALRPAPQLEAGRGDARRAPRRPARRPRESATSSARPRPLYDKFETVDQRTRLRAYRDAMARARGAVRRRSGSVGLLRAGARGGGGSGRQDLRDQLKAGAILEKLWRGAARSPGHARTTSSTATTCRRSRRARSTRRGATRRSRPTRRTRCTCRRTPSRASATGRIRSTPTSCRPRRRARSTPSAKSCTPSDYQTYAYLQSGQDAAARRVVESLPEMLARRGPATASAAPPSAGRVCAGGDPGALRARARRVGRRRARSSRAPRRSPYADAMTWFARALGAARMRDVAGRQGGRRRAAEGHRSHRRRRKKPTGSSRSRSRSSARRHGWPSRKGGPPTRSPRCARPRIAKTGRRSRRSRQGRWPRRASCSARCCSS